MDLLSSQASFNDTALGSSTIGVMQIVFCGIEQEVCVAIIDCTTAPREQLLAMLQAEKGFTAISPGPVPAAPTARVQDHGPPHQHMSTIGLAGRQQGQSLSELSVCDPGMKDPQSWWLSVQQVSFQTDV